MGSITINIDDKTKKDLKMEALKHDSTVTEIITDLIRGFLGKIEKEENKGSKK